MSTICGNNGDIYKDPSCTSTQRAEDLLARMSWSEKVKQLGGIRQVLGGNMSFNKTKFDIFNEAQDGNIGYGNQFNPALPALQLVNKLRENQTASGLGIPYVLVTDSINGIYLFNGTLFPGTLSMASSFNVPLYGEVIASIREECKAIGINWVLSPELDVVTDPRYGRVGETYGEDPYLNGEFGLRYVQTIQEKDENGFMKVAATIKHFVYGWEAGGINTAHQYGGINHVYNDMLPPFIRIISEGNPASLMVSYSSLDRVPMSANKFMLQRVLRDDLKFEGIIMSDAGALNDLAGEFRIAQTSQDAAILAVKAGMQMELSPGEESATQTLVNVTNDAEITALVSNATFKILELKFNLGLFDSPLPSVENAIKILRAPPHLEAARNISRESIVLLQNDGFLPLGENKSRTIAVLGPYASIIDPGSYAPHSTADQTHGNSLLQSLQHALGSQNVIHEPGVDFLDRSNSTGIASAVTAANSADLAILSVGSLSVYASDPLYDKRTDGEFFTHADLGFPGLQQELIDAVLDTGVPTIIVLSGGQAFVLNNSTLRANAILHTFLAGEYTADSVVEILSGQVNPSGKLPISLPQANGAFPVAYNWLPSDNHGGSSGSPIHGSSAWQFPALTIEPPMAFGFGLSYTSFNISEVEVKQASDGGDPAFEVSATVTNTGSVAGQEVVQLYFRQSLSTIELPVKRLIRFAKVGLGAGRSKVVTFVVPQEEMGYYLNMEWIVEKGRYTFYVGSSSRSEDLQERDVTIG
ncbi:uncharacterized protein N7484_008828 [Penicillium longicatenatum]|uniref:uncharacterized protein n=1 Tax=Penicillium longicatenatum TaxID=1561947 RepID=UPI002546FCEE|nr:uncharacterized protein N7484_008828 [Penicillium longicatenatum]KAJ5635515.1 hypothetical protein N7484_008828 [Penicillium longicatenatum]